MLIQEDPLFLTPVQWLKRAARLPIREAMSRVMHLIVSTSRNLVRIQELARLAKKDHKRLHLIILTERLGDIIASEPTIRKLKRTDDYAVRLVRPHFADALKFNPNIDAILPVSSYTETILLRLLQKSHHWTNLQMDGALCNMFGIAVKNPVPAGVNVHNYYHKGTLADVFSLIDTNEIASGRPKLYPATDFDALEFISKIFANPNQPLVLIHPVSDEAARSWTAEQAAIFVRWLLEHTNSNIIELGLTPFLPPSDRVFALRDKLSLSQQFAVISKASVFTGVDSGFAHVANAAGIPSILLIGAYQNFVAHVPWKVDDRDFIIRSEGQTCDLPAQAIIEAYQRKFYQQA